ncbi:MAG: hypothetical protein IJ733_19940 [Lachnospiraceae bacterium]|nr:hypothetical protein [Lachnospiraceae bacterium]
MTNFMFKTLTEDRNREDGDLTSGMEAGRMIKDAIAEMVQERFEMTDEEKKAMDSRIEWKLKNGEKLSAKEMEYLKMYHPDLYRVALKIEMKRKMLRNQLKHAKSKEEVHHAVSIALAGADKDPDKAYVIAMINKEAGDFMKSAAYARLPQSIEKRKKKNSESERYYANKERKEQEEDRREGGNPFAITMRYSMFTVLKVQCEQIGELAQNSRV